MSKLDWFGRIGVQTFCKGLLMEGKSKKEIIVILENHSMFNQKILIDHMKELWKDDLW